MDFGIGGRRFRLVHRFVPGGKKASVQIETVLPRTDAFAGLPAGGSLPLSFENAEMYPRVFTAHRRGLRV